MQGILLTQADEVGEVVEMALRMGYRHIDEAAMYGNQDGVGRTFTKLFKEGTIKREDIWVTSKVCILFLPTISVTLGRHRKSTPLHSALHF